MQLSVIICTHNPRQDYLRRTLDALQTQTLASKRWELLLVDNASNESLSKAWDLSWHPQARHIREDELGLTPARVRGIKESSGELLVFVDDDNVLASDYLERALAIHIGRPQVGAFGAGKILGEFEPGFHPQSKSICPCWRCATTKRQPWTTKYNLTAHCRMAPDNASYARWRSRMPMRRILTKSVAGGWTAGARHCRLVETLTST